MTNNLSAKLKLTLHHYNRQNHDVYYSGFMEVILPNQEPVPFEVSVYNADKPLLREVVIRKARFQVVRVQPDSEVRLEDGTPERVIVFAVFAPLIFSAIAQIKLQEDLAVWADTTQGIRALVGLEPLYHLTISETAEWMYAGREGFEWFEQAVLKEYSEL